MKTIGKFTVAIGMLFGTTLGLANVEKSSVAVQVNGMEKSLVLSWEHQLGQTSIKLTDVLDRVVFYRRDTVSSSDYKMKFDLDKLENGSYLLEVDNMTRLVEYKIAIENDEVKVLERREVAKPVFSQKDGMLSFNLLNLDDSDVNVKVLDSQSNVVYAETLNGLSIGKQINFKGAYADTYAVVVSDNGKRHTEYVKVE